MIRRWIDRLLRYEQIDGNGRCPVYLHRWTLLKLPFGIGMYLHKFVGDDWSLDLHDHPKRFVSIGLKGEYVEERPTTRYPTGLEFEIFTAPWVRSFPAEHMHRLAGPTPDRPCWTLVLVGPKRREWGFLTSAGWIKWSTYVHPSNAAATARRSC